MILDIQAVVGTAIVLLALPCSAKHSHGRLRRDLIARRNAHMSQRAAPQTDSNDASAAQKRSTQCAFPTNAGLVPVTPTSSNAGWAMSPDQSCTPGSWCPYACPPGQVGTNWNPKATSYSYPDSMVWLTPPVWHPAHCHRMEACIVTRMAPSRYHQMASTAPLGQVPRPPSTISAEELHFVKLCCPATRPC